MTRRKRTNNDLQMLQRTIQVKKYKPH